MIGRRSFRVGRIIILSFEGFTIFYYFSTRFYIGGRTTFFRIFLIFGRDWKVFSS